MGEPLIPLPTVEKVSSRVIRVLGGNPGKVTSPYMHGYVITDSL